MDYDRTREVLAAFERHGVRYAVFGGVALNMKSDTIRLRDRADAARLRQQFGFEDE